MLVIIHNKYIILIQAVNGIGMCGWEVWKFFNFLKFFLNL